MKHLAWRRMKESFEFEIDTETSQPVRAPLLRTPLAMREEMACQVSKMHQTGIISPSKKPPGPALWYSHEQRMGRTIFVLIIQLRTSHLA